MAPILIPLISVIGGLGGGLYIKRIINERQALKQPLRVARSEEGDREETPPEFPLELTPTALERQLSALAGALQFERLTQFFLDKTRSRHLQNSLGISKSVETRDDETNSPKQIEADRRVGAVTIGMGLTLGGVFYTPIYILLIPILGYIFIPYYRCAYRELVKRRKIGLAFLDSVFLTGALVGNFFLVLLLGAWLIELSGNLLVRTEGRFRKKLTRIFSELPNRVWVLRDGVELEIPLERLSMDDVVLVFAGQTVPVDGTILRGNVSVDQHMLTGESQPVEKAPGDQVLASTQLIAGSMQIKVEQTGEEKRAAQILNMLENTTSSTSLTQAQGIEMAEQAVVPVLGLGALGLSTVGSSGALALLKASFGYNLRLISPLSLLNFLQIASEYKILIKDGRSLEQLSNIDTVVFDKTGTLTLEQPTVGTIHAAVDLPPATLLRYAAAAERHQSHPIAQAILSAARAQGLEDLPVEESRYDMGYGITVRFDDQLIRVGSRRFMALNDISIPACIEQAQQDCDENGYSLVYVALDQALGGAIELRPTLRPEAQQVIAGLQRRQLDLFIISGDQERPTRKLAGELGVERYFAETLPEDKANIVAGLQREGRKVCFIGDGINDSIALKQADVSISLLGATTIATDTAQVVFMDQKLDQLNFLFEIGDDYKINMKRGLLTTIFPGGAVIGGVFFFGMGIYGGIAIYNLGLAVGISNALLLPRWKYPLKIKNNSNPLLLVPQGE
ncbi:MAG: heavy metal translocating P-type ATPase [Candidatus Competibacterales bacterium]